MYRTILIPDNRDIHIKLPASLVGKKIEIIANITDRKRKTKRKAKTLPALKLRQAGESWKEIKEFYYSINVDTKSYKFNREEANER